MPKNKGFGAKTWIAIVIVIILLVILPMFFVFVYPGMAFYYGPLRDSPNLVLYEAPGHPNTPFCTYGGQYSCDWWVNKNYEIHMYHTNDRIKIKGPIVLEWKYVGQIHGRDYIELISQDRVILQSENDMWDYTLQQSGGIEGSPYCPEFFCNRDMHVKVVQPTFNDLIAATKITYPDRI